MATILSRPQCVNGVHWDSIGSVTYASDRFPVPMRIRIEAKKKYPNGLVDDEKVS